MRRRKRALKLITPRTQSGLEIGPLVSPMVTPDMGNIAYADHATTEELRKKYANDTNVDESKIVDITFVWGEQTLAEAVGKDALFDYVIASHVIEHVPDVITWLKEISAVLKPGGILSLMIPDKRFTFDVKRSCSITADAIDACLNGLRKPAPRHVYDHFSNVVSADTTNIWTRGNTGGIFKKMFTDPSIGLNMAQRAFNDWDSPHR